MDGGGQERKSGALTRVLRCQNLQLDDYRPPPLHTPMLRPPRPIVMSGGDGVQEIHGLPLTAGGCALARAPAGAAAVARTGLFWLGRQRTPAPLNGQRAHAPASSSGVTTPLVADTSTRSAGGASWRNERAHGGPATCQRAGRGAQPNTLAAHNQPTRHRCCPWPARTLACSVAARGHRGYNAHP